MSAEAFDVVFCKQRDEDLAARVDAAADTIIKSHEPGSPKRDRLITLVTNLHHSAGVFGVDTGAWRGCLLDLVREAWGDQGAHLMLVRAEWLLTAVGWTRGKGSREAEALVAGLESVPT